MSPGDPDGGAATLWEALCETVRTHADRTAIIHGDTQLSFADWQRRALDFTRYLQANGLNPGDRVLLWQEPSPDMACALFGTWAAGAIPVLIDPKARDSHIDHALAVTGARFVFHAPGNPLPDTRHQPLQTAVDSVPAGEAPPADAPVPERHGPASIVFTSGSTGHPKGVTQSHANLVRGAGTVAGYLGIDAGDRILCPVPWAFDYGFVQLQMTAVTGATHILPEAANPFGICAAIEQHAPTVFPGVPSLYGYLMQGVSPFRETDLRSLRLLTNTGGTIPGPVLSELLGLVDHAEVVLNYGLTESYRSSFLQPALVHERPDSIGKAIPGVEIVIVREDGSLAEPGEIGEIVHRGDLVFLEYWGNPDATARSRRPDPLDPESGAVALFTGDLGRMDEDGFLYYEGRRDRQLKVMGVRVSPEEVEELLHASGLIDQVAVFGIPHELLDREICAAVVPKGEVDSGELRKQLIRHARATMTQNMSPRRFLFLDDMPKTATGKTDYPALERMARQQ